MIWIKALEEFQKCFICSFKKTFQELKCSRFFYVVCTNIWSLLNHQREMIFNDKDTTEMQGHGFLWFLELQFKFGHLNLWTNFGCVLILKYTLTFCILCLFFLLPSKQATYYKCFQWGQYQCTIKESILTLDEQRLQRGIQI